jgi:Holliday junction resolvasome RuvABC ATP-dependent DNA helicase subunit
MKKEPIDAQSPLLETKLRPKNLDDYIGQEQAKKALRLFMKCTTPMS